jgi:alkylation response protein AidB-like acyl-CoA dehydrogenase
LNCQSHPAKIIRARETMRAPRVLRGATASSRPRARGALTRALSSTVASAEAPRPAKEPWRTRPGLNRFHDRRDVDFVLFEVEGMAYAESRAEALAVLDSVESLVAAWGHVDPVLDQEPPTLTPAAETADGKATVRVHPQTKALLRELCDRGFFQMGELGLPFPVQCAASFLLGCGFSSNPIGFAVLTRCAADLLEAHGTAALKEQYLKPMRAGEVFGTMALSEPQAGSSLAAIRTLARRSEISEGREAPLGPEWRIKGNKMWTSGAFHDV